MENGTLDVIAKTATIFSPMVLEDQVTQMVKGLN